MSTTVELLSSMRGTLFSLSVITIGGAPSASAWLAAFPSRQSPSAGGTWTYGYSFLTAKSYYHHSPKCHGSTVKVDDDTYASANTEAGKTSDAYLRTTDGWWRDDSYYYRIC